MVSTREQPCLRAAFPPVAASVGGARRLVRTLLEAHDLEELIDTSALLVSEVATNAVLHAATEFEVSCRPGRRGVRVQVRDRSTVLPRLKRYDDAAMTGRGLELLDVLSSGWGVEADDHGKAVWFELAADGRTGSGHAVINAANDRRAGFTVHLRALPVALVRAALEHADDALRELMLADADARARGGDGGASPTGLASGPPGMDLGTLPGELARAAAQGRERLDATVHLDATAVEAALTRLWLVEEAERVARRRRLLIEPASTEMATCRRWIAAEIVRQEQGEAPCPWSDVPIAAAVVGQVAPAALEEIRTALGAAPCIAVEGAGRILTMSPQAAAALGWGPRTLEGAQVLTSVIAPSWRDVHVVSAMRHLLTGEHGLVGRPLRGPLQRRDLTEFEVELVIQSQRAGGETFLSYEFAPVELTRGPAPRAGAGE